MLDFTKDSVFNLHKTDNSNLNKNAAAILIAGEEVVGVYKTVRDQVVFTNKRIITVDVEGVTGARQEIASLPYNRVQYFTIQTKGFLEMLPDSELVLHFSNGLQLTFDFRGKNDICEISRVIGTYALD